MAFLVTKRRWDGPEPLEMRREENSGDETLVDDVAGISGEEIVEAVRALPRGTGRNRGTILTIGPDRGVASIRTPLRPRHGESSPISVFVPHDGRTILGTRDVGVWMLEAGNDDPRLAAGGSPPGTTRRDAPFEGSRRIRGGTRIEGRRRVCWRGHRPPTELIPAVRSLRARPLPSSSSLRRTMGQDRPSVASAADTNPSREIVDSHRSVGETRMTPTSSNFIDADLRPER